MKKILFVLALMVSAVFVQAQDAKIKVANMDAAEKIAEKAEVKADEKVASEALAAAAADENIKTEKRDVFFRKYTCEKTGETKWEEVYYCAEGKTFKSVKKKTCSKKCSKEGKKCDKSSKKCAKKGGKKCCKKDGKKCTKKEGAKKVEAIKSEEKSEK